MKWVWLCLCIVVAIRHGQAQTTNDYADYSGMDGNDQTNSGDEVVTPETANGETSISPSGNLDVNDGTISPFILPIWDPSKDINSATSNPDSGHGKEPINEPDYIVIASKNPDDKGDSEIDFVITPDDNNSSESFNITNLHPIIDDIVKKLIEEFNSTLTDTMDGSPQPAGLIVGGSDDDSDEFGTTTRSSRSRIVTNPPSFILPFVPIPDNPIMDKIKSNSSFVPIGAQIEGERPSGQFFCLAQCMAFCISNQITEEPSDCKDFCAQYQAINNPCDDKDAQCWKYCNKDWTDLSKAPQNVPTISGSSYIDDAQFQQQYIRIFWPEVPNATLYVIEIIPNPTSMINGAVMARDVAFDNYYVFLKPNLCYEYYVRVAAVNGYGISQFGPSSFVQSTSSQLSLNFNVVDTYSQDTFDGITEVTPVDQNNRRTLVRMTYTDDDSNFNLENFDLKNYLLATDCSNTVDPILFEEVPIDTLLSSKVYKVNAVTFAYGERFLFIILPNAILNADCIYTFRVESITNTCGKVASFSTPGSYNSEVGTSFRLNCDNVRDSMCSTLAKPLVEPMFPVLLETTELPPLTEQPSNAQTDLPLAEIEDPIVVPNLPVSIDCRMTGFNVDVVNNVKIDKLNVTIWWDAVINDVTKVYFVRHGTAIRQLFPSYDEEMSFDFDDPVPVVDDNTNEFMKSMKLPSVDKYALHAFQICVSYNGANMDDFPWDSAPKHVVDFAALPAASSNDLSQDSQDSIVKIESVDIKDINGGSNKSAVSWIVVLASLFVAILCFTLMSIVFIYYTCCRQRKMRQIFVKNILPAQASYEKPIPIIAA